MVKNIQLSILIVISRRLTVCFVWWYLVRLVLLLILNIFNQMCYFLLLFQILLFIRHIFYSHYGKFRSNDADFFYIIKNCQYQIFSKILQRFLCKSQIFSWCKVIKTMNWCLMGVCSYSIWVKESSWSSLFSLWYLKFAWIIAKSFRSHCV